MSSDVLTRKGRPIKFTPERIQQIKNLIERGTSREEIAELLDVTVGSLQVTCSRLGISLRRPIFNTGTGLLGRGSRYSNNLSILTPSLKGAPSMQQTTEQTEPTERAATQQSEQSPQRAEPGHAARTDEASCANLAVTVQYKGRHRSTELPLTQDMIQRIALEAQLRDMQMGQLLGELVTAVMTRDLIPPLLGREQTEKSDRLVVEEIKVFPG